MGGGDVTVRAEKDGYAPQTTQLTLSDDGRQDLELQPLGATNIAGVYALTITASPSCHLPAELMRRAYQAQIRYDTQGGLLVMIAPETWPGFGAGYGFTGTLDRIGVRFQISDDIDGEWWFSEDLKPGEYLRWRGTASGSVTDRRITAQLSGRVRYLRNPGLAVVAECEAADHQLEFVR